jgi:hypothetical protein
LPHLLSRANPKQLIISSEPRLRAVILRQRLKRQGPDALVMQFVGLQEITHRCRIRATQQEGLLNRRL